MAMGLTRARPGVFIIHTGPATHPWVSGLRRQHRFFADCECSAVPPPASCQAHDTMADLPSFPVPTIYTSSSTSGAVGTCKPRHYDEQVHQHNKWTDDPALGGVG